MPVWFRFGWPDGDPVVNGWQVQMPGGALEGAAHVGRRWRVWLYLLAGKLSKLEDDRLSRMKQARPITAEEAYRLAWNVKHLRERYDCLALTQKAHQDPELVPSLQDLAYEISEDIREACFALWQPDIWYPGVDEGIEPVTLEHIERAIPAMQRELDREENRLSASGTKKMPRLKDLPERVQRALVERRRLRFAEYGIGREQWERGMWSLWDVRLDQDWVPRRYVRLGQ